MLWLLSACGPAQVQVPEAIDFDRELDLLHACSAHHLEADGWHVVSRGEVGRRLMTAWTPDPGTQERVVVVMGLHPEWGPAIRAQRECRVAEAGEDAAHAPVACGEERDAAARQWEAAWLADVQQCWRRRRIEQAP
jgi:hypothetical protein